MAAVPDEPRGDAKGAAEPESPAASVIADVAAGINEGNTAVFCGAGISLASGFPIVYQLLPYVLAHLCSMRCKSISESIQNVPQLIEKIARKTGVPASSIEKLLTKLPFEAFIQTLGDNRNVDHLLALFDANSYNPPVMPSTNHTVAVVSPKRVTVTLHRYLPPPAVYAARRAGNDLKCNPGIGTGTAGTAPCAAGRDSGAADLLDSLLCRSTFGRTQPARQR